MRCKQIPRAAALGAGFLAVLSVVMLINACTATPEQGAKATTAPAPTAATRPSKGAAQIWGETCAQCHNIRDPGEFSDAQWAVIVHHMRQQAKLTGEEQRQIRVFLQSAN